MVESSSVFIKCCQLSTALICLVIDVSRLHSDRVSDLIEIKGALLHLGQNNGDVYCRTSGSGMHFIVMPPNKQSYLFSEHLVGIKCFSWPANSVL